MHIYVGGEYLFNLPPQLGSLIFFKGQDSVGAAVAFSLYYLAKNKEVQERAFEEVQKVFITEKPTFEQLKSAVYLEQCIKETLRLCPSVPMFARKLTEDVFLGKNKNVKK